MRTLVFIAVLVLALSCGGASQASTVERSGPEGRLTFASDGRIYVVNLDGSGLQMIVDGNNVPQEGRDWFLRQPEWAAAPAFSPDGTRVAFIRDLDVWLVNADGSDQRRLADIADGPPETCAGLSACTPQAPSNLSWSPDGSEIAVMLQRAGGGSGVSGMGVIDVATGDFRRLKGRYVDSMMFMTVSWSAAGSLTIAPSKGIAARIDPASGDELPSVALVDAPWPATVVEAPDGEWLTGSFGEEGPILYGTPGALSQVATGLSPAFSPDAQWVAYFQGETIRVVRTDGSDDREVLDLAPLGGRDRLAASKDCFPKYNDSCSYRAAELSWTTSARARTSSHVKSAPVKTAQAAAKTEQGPPSGRLTFASDGRIYVVNVDGSGLQMIVDGNNAPQDGLEMRIRLPEWAAAPAFSPDGTQVAFVRDLDVWLVNADGSDQRLLGDVADFKPSQGASNGTIGASNVAWSPDGTRVAYMLERAGGSGISGGGVVVVATGEVHRFHGSNIDSGSFTTVSWLPDDTIGFAPGTDDLVRIDPATGDELTPLPLPRPRPWPTGVAEAANGALLAGSFVSDAAILYGQPGWMTQIATGLSPTFSPDQEWVAYFKGETIRVVRTNGLDDREVLDLTPLGGRDRHFASPDCYSVRMHDDSCSYRPPVVSWASP